MSTTTIAAEIEAGLRSRLVGGPAIRGHSILDITVKIDPREPTIAWITLTDVGAVGKRVERLYSHEWLDNSTYDPMRICDAIARAYRADLAPVPTVTDREQSSH